MSIPITAKELSAELRQKVFTIHRWRREGLIPHIDVGYRTKLFDLESVKAALLKRQKKAGRR
jgi:DNA-binding transcriptional MerR regulator